MKKYEIKRTVNGEILIDKTAYDSFKGNILPTNNPMYQNVIDRFGNKIGSIEKDYFGNRNFKPNIPLDTGGWKYEV